MTTTICVAFYALCIGLGIGQRMEARAYRKEAERAAAEFKAQAAKLDQAITAAETRLQGK